MMKQPGMVVLVEPLLLGAHLSLRMAAKVALAEIQQGMAVLAVPAVEEETEGPVEMVVLMAAAEAEDQVVQTFTVATAVLMAEEAVVEIANRADPAVLMAAPEDQAQHRQPMDRLLLMR